MKLIKLLAGGLALMPLGAAAQIIPSDVALVKFVIISPDGSDLRVPCPTLRVTATGPGFEAATTSTSNPMSAANHCYGSLPIRSNSQMTLTASGGPGVRISPATELPTAYVEAFGSTELAQPPAVQWTNPLTAKQNEVVWRVFVLTEK